MFTAKYSHFPGTVRLEEAERVVKPIKWWWGSSLTGRPLLPSSHWLRGCPGLNVSSLSKEGIVFLCQRSLSYTLLCKLHTIYLNHWPNGEKVIPIHTDMFTTVTFGNTFDNSRILVHAPPEVSFVSCENQVCSGEPWPSGRVTILLGMVWGLCHGICHMCYVCNTVMVISHCERFSHVHVQFSSVTHSATSWSLPSCFTFCCGQIATLMYVVVDLQELKAYSYVATYSMYVPHMLCVSCEQPLLWLKSFFYEEGPSQCIQW